MNNGQRPDFSFDSTFRSKVSAALEVILNLSYLAKVEAEHPEKVRAHMELIEQRISDLSRLVNMPAHGSRSEDPSKGGRTPRREN